jgi:hypothetical protein
VLILHGLVAKADKTACALVNAEERTALLGVPDDYGAGRKVLVNLGLLPTNSNARSFNPIPDSATLVSLVAGDLKECMEKAKSDPRLIKLPDDRRSIVTFTLNILFVHITRRVLRQIYGTEMSDAFYAILPDESFKPVLEELDRKLSILAKTNPTMSPDLALLYLIMATTGTFPETKEAYIREYDWMQMVVDWINQERVCLQDYLRFSLRWLSDHTFPNTYSDSERKTVDAYHRQSKDCDMQDDDAKIILFIEDRIDNDA